MTLTQIQRNDIIDSYMLPRSIKLSAGWDPRNASRIQLLEDASWLLHLWQGSSRRLTYCNWNPDLLFWSPLSVLLDPLRLLFDPWERQALTMSQSWWGHASKCWVSKYWSKKRFCKILLPVDSLDSLEGPNRKMVFIEKEISPECNQSKPFFIFFFITSNICKTPDLKCRN